MNDLCQARSCISHEGITWTGWKIYAAEDSRFVKIQPVMISGALLDRLEGTTETGIVSLVAISTPPPREGLSLRYIYCSLWGVSPGHRWIQIAMSLLDKLHRNQMSRYKIGIVIKLLMLR